MFEGAEAPERDDAEESEDGPAASAKGWSACAYFAVDEAEEGWAMSAMSRRRKRTGSKMKTKEPAYQWGFEGKEGANAVVVGPVEQDVAEKGDEGEAIEESPADGACGLGMWVVVGSKGWSGMVSGWVCFRWERQRWKSHTPPTMMAASNGMPMKVWVMPRWCWKAAMGPRMDQRVSRSGASAAIVMATVA